MEIQIEKVSVKAPVERLGQKIGLDQQAEGIWDDKLTGSSNHDMFGHPGAITTIL